MTQSEHYNFSQLFSETLARSGIEYANSFDGDAYVVYDESGILFSVTFYKNKQKYVFGHNSLFKAKYEKYGIPTTAKPNDRMVYETVAFAYKTQQLIRRAQKDYSVIYKDLLIDSDILFQMRANFETYVVYNVGMQSYAIGYDTKTHKYEFKKYELVETLYKVCDIPMDKRPEYEDLYKRTRDAYMAQVALENIAHLYDF